MTILFYHYFYHHIIITLTICHSLSLSLQNLKLICSTNSVFHGLSGSVVLLSRILNPYRRPTKWALACACFSFFFLTFFLFLATCVRLSWPHSAFQSTLNSSVVSCRVVLFYSYNYVHLGLDLAPWSRRLKLGRSDVTLHVQCESKNPPWGYLTFFSFYHKRLRIFNRFLTHLLYVPI